MKTTHRSPRSWSYGAAALAGLLASGALHAADAAEEGDVTMPLLLGTNVYTHRFDALGYTAKDTTIADSFGLSEFVGSGFFVSKRVRLGISVQFTEALTNPPAEGAFTTFAILPQFNYNFWGPLTVSLVPTFAARLAAINQFGFAVQGVLAASLPLGGGIAATIAVEVPVYMYPYVSIGVTPLFGITYHLPTRHT